MDTSGLLHSMWPFSVFDLISYLGPQLALKRLCWGFKHTQSLLQRTVNTVFIMLFPKPAVISYYIAFYFTYSTIQRLYTCMRNGPMCNALSLGLWKETKMNKTIHTTEEFVLGTQIVTEFPYYCHLPLMLTFNKSCIITSFHCFNITSNLIVYFLKAGDLFYRVSVSPILATSGDTGHY